MLSFNHQRVDSFLRLSNSVFDRFTDEILILFIFCSIASLIFINFDSWSKSSDKGTNPFDVETGRDWEFSLIKIGCLVFA